MRRVLTLVLAAVVALALLPSFATASAGVADSAPMQPRLSERLETAAPTDRLLVFVHADDIATAQRAVRDTGLAPAASWDRVAVATGWGTPAQIRAVAERDGVTYVEGDQPAEYLTDTSHQATRGEYVLDNYTDADGNPVDGRGVSVAVVDTGVDGNHPAFELDDGTSKVARNLKSVCPFLTPSEPNDDFLNQCFVDAPGNDTDTISVGGHGTHVAGIAAGVFDSTEAGTEVHGAAPGATVISLSVGATISIYAGNQGLNWVLANHENPCADNPVPGYPDACDPIKVVNNSWGPPGGGEYDPDSAVAKIQDALVEDGVVVVWAAGNANGDGSENRVNPPAQAPTGGILGVANYDDHEFGMRDGRLARSSSRGEEGRPETYPDISAPGSNILQACTYVLAICRSHGDLRYAWYAEISGTSMAAPHIAGIVAQVFQADPTLTPADVEDLLEDTAYEFTFGADYEDDPTNADSDTSFDKGHGLVDAAAAVADILDETAPDDGE